MSIEGWRLFPDNDIRFVGEQFGIVENELKGKLVDIFECNKLMDQPSRAYLARVEYGESRDFDIALCMPSFGEGEQTLANEVANIFREMFGSHEHLDIVFINEIQERKLRKVCCPFYCVKYFECPDFFLTSSEGYDLEEIRACYKEKRLMNGHPDGYMLCKIEPPILGQKYNSGDQMIDEIIIASRHADYSIFHIEEWPAYVHVLRLENYIKPKNFDFTEKMARSIGWAEIYDTYLTAKTSR